MPLTLILLGTTVIGSVAVAVLLAATCYALAIRSVLVMIRVRYAALSHPTRPLQYR